MIMFRIRVTGLLSTGQDPILNYVCILITITQRFCIQHFVKNIGELKDLKFKLSEIHQNKFRITKRFID